MSHASDFVGVHLAGGYGKDLGAHVSSGGSNVSRQRVRMPPPPKESMHTAVGKALRTAWHPTTSINAYTRHKMLVNDYIKYYGGAGYKKRIQESIVKVTDADVVRAEHRFLWEERDGEAAASDADTAWRRRLAKKYYDKLFKEYALADLKHYKDGRIGFRWRTEQEVLEGKGQFVCGHKRCSVRTELRSYEVNFAYKEHGERRQALVKVRVCPECATKLYYKKIKAVRKLQKQQARRMERRECHEDEEDTHRARKKKRRDHKSSDVEHKVVTAATQSSSNSATRGLAELSEADGHEYIAQVRRVLGESTTASSPSASTAATTTAGACASKSSTTSASPQEQRRAKSKRKSKHAAASASSRSVSAEEAVGTGGGAGGGAGAGGTEAAAAAAGSSAAGAATEDGAAWSEQVIERTRGDDFDDYFQGMFP